MKGLFKPDSVVQSFLDTDLYKFLMQQAVFETHHGVEVKASFQSRNGEDVSDYLTEIREEIEKLADLEFEESDIWYLNSLGKTAQDSNGFFKPSFLSFLKNFKLAPRQCQLSINNQKQLKITATGSWIDILHFEVFILTIISEIRNRHKYPKLSSDDALKQMVSKVEGFLKLAEKKNINLDNFRLCDFGTRRRFNYQTQWSVIDYLKHALPENCFIGTSNLHIAHEMQLQSVGTQGHEWYMAHQQLAVLQKFQCAAMNTWIEVYQGMPGIAVTDTISTQSFLKDFSLFYAKLFDGVRHDSGDPFEWGEKILEHYESMNINPQHKKLIFSNQLDLDENLLKIYHAFQSRAQVIFGIGGNITCDLPKCQPTNMVMKIIECQGHPVAKLSDSNAKISSSNPTFLHYLKEVFNYKSKG